MLSLTATRKEGAHGLEARSGAGSVVDVDQAKNIYSQQVGFVVDLDTRISDEAHLVQLTRPGQPARSN